MNAGVLVENQRLFYKTKGFQGQVVILIAHCDAAGKEVDPPKSDSNRGYSYVESMKWGWKRVVAISELHYMKKATFKEWSRSPDGTPG